jgi:crotonobetainyl-CoA:carnitine CoA-transferase CaiB-like acyl-CoA transferase
MRGFYDMQIDGVTLEPNPTDRLPLARAYRAGDGRWIQLYGVIKPLDALILESLGAESDEASVAEAVSRSSAADSERRLTAVGAPAAVIRTRAEWAGHPQGRWLSTQPLLSVEPVGDAPRRPATPGRRPLSGIRVLDLTRVVAGPVCGRTLGEHGADVLSLCGRSLPWIRRAMIDTAVGKRSAFLDLKSPADRGVLLQLVDAADVFCEGSRPGRLAAAGLGVAELTARRPGLIYVSIDGWGTGGPWRDHAGFEAVAQAATGWTSEHMVDGIPQPLSALAGDHLTGYLAALGVLSAISRQIECGGSWHVHVSLARTVEWLQAHGAGLDPAQAIDLSVGATADLRLSRPGGFGNVFQLAPAPAMSLTSPAWSGGAFAPGTHRPAFATA